MEEVLPDDMLADVLARLPPSSLAASRCVRKHWCSIIDARRLLRADLLPLRLDAFYCINLGLIERLTYLFARPAAARRILGGCLDFLEGYTDLEVQDHCNGLLLVYGTGTVVNPATRQWATLPDAPEPSICDMLGVPVLGTMTGEEKETMSDEEQETMSGEEQDTDCFYSKFYLVYDPMAQSQQHFEVFLIPSLKRHLNNRGDITIDIEEQEWPPSTFRTHVFSSSRWMWEERSWIRQGEPAGTMADMMRPDDCYDREAVYFRGVLYVQCQNDSVMRINLSNDNKYQMVRSPVTRSKLGVERATFYLGKSEKGVYYALLYWIDFDICPQFRVWLLNEKKEINDENHIIQMEWVLKTNISLEPLLTKPSPLHCHTFVDDEWSHTVVDDEWRVIRKYSEKELGEPPAVAAHDDDEFAAHNEWDFDNADEIVLEANNDNKGEVYTYPVEFLGFHPYKEIVFFSLSSRTISYNLNTSKVQKLGGGICLPVGVRKCYPYTPCLLTMGELFENS